VDLFCGPPSIGFRYEGAVGRKAIWARLYFSALLFFSVLITFFSSNSLFLFNCVCQFDQCVFLALEESRAVPLASLLGTMGGNLGLFLGMSIMTFLEFFEFFVIVLLSSLCCCGAKKVLSKKKTKEEKKPTEVEMEEISVVY